MVRIMYLESLVSSNCREQKKLPPKMIASFESPANSKRRAIVYAIVLFPDPAEPKSQ